MHVQWLDTNLATRVIGSILKHDKKVNSYKIGLVRAVSDVVLSHPDLANANLDFAVPLRRLAQQWVAYYWPSVDPDFPVLQGRYFLHSLLDLALITDRDPGEAPNSRPAQPAALLRRQMPSGTVPCTSEKRSASPSSNSKPVDPGATVKIACP